MRVTEIDETGVLNDVQFAVSGITSDTVAYLYDETRDPLTVTSDGTQGIFYDDFAPNDVHIYRIPKYAGPCYDLTGDGRINIFDLVFVAIRLGNGEGDPADVTGDDGVNIQDLQAVAALFGMNC